MKKEDLEKLKKLLPEFSEEELERLFRENPSLSTASPSLFYLFEKVKKEPIPSLPPDFTPNLMARIQAPTLGERIKEFFFSARGLSLAGAVATSVVLAALFLPRFFPSTSFPGLAYREETGTHQEKIYFVRFALKNPRAHSVSVAGDFNQWAEVPLTLADAREGLYTVELPMPSGTYAYSFLVDGKKWIADPTADRVIDDGFGNKNSLMNL